MIGLGAVTGQFVSQFIGVSMVSACSTYRFQGACELVLVIGIVRGDSEGEERAGGAGNRRLRGTGDPVEAGGPPGC